jgi:BASS family bile acid:Na+ symporter
MTIAQLIPLVLSASIFLNVLALGLVANFADATYLFRRPALLLRAVLSMNVVMVLIVVAATSIFDLTFPVRTMLLALAVSPVPPLLPKKEQKVGASQSYAVGLLVSAVLLSLIFIPWSIEWIGSYFGADVHVSAARIAPIVLISAIAPLFIGMLIHRFMPDVARRASRPIGLLSMILLLLGVLPILFTLSGEIWKTVVDGAVIALACFTLIGLAVGHMLGGPDPGERTALALATCSRHPGIALTIASINYPEQKPAFMAVILLHLIIGAIVSIPYLRWRRHQASVALTPL